VLRYRIFGPKGRLIVRKATAARVKAILPGLRRRFGHVRVVAFVIRAKPRDRVVAWARWGVRNKQQIHYTEGAGRSAFLQRRPGALPLFTDCSGFVTACYKWSGLPDPNGREYKTLGYTGTLLDYGKPVNRQFLRPGDIVVYGPGTGVHTAVIVKGGFDPLTVSDGDEAAPDYVYVSQDNRQPIRFLTFLP
jgi:hypothetical protein